MKTIFDIGKRMGNYCTSFILPNEELNSLRSLDIFRNPASRQIDVEIINEKLQMASNEMESPIIRAEIMQSLVVLTSHMQKDTILSLTTEFPFVQTIISIILSMAREENDMVLWGLQILQAVIIKESVLTVLETNDIFISQLGAFVNSTRSDIQYNSILCLEKIAQFEFAKEVIIKDILNPISICLSESKNANVIQSIVRLLTPLATQKENGQIIVQKVLLKLVSLLKIDSPLASPTLFCNIASLLTFLAQNEYIAGLILQTKALRKLDLIFQHNYNLPTTWKIATCIIVLCSFEQFEGLIDSRILLSIYNLLIVGNNITSQSIGLDALLQFVKIGNNALTVLNKPDLISNLGDLFEYLQSDYVDLQLHSLCILEKLSFQFTTKKAQDDLELVPVNGELPLQAIQSSILPVSPIIIELFQVNICKIINLLQKEKGNKQHQVVLDILFNLSHNEKIQEKIVEHSGLNSILHSISSDNLQIQNSALSLIHNLSNSEINQREICRSSIILSQLLNLTKDHQQEIIVQKSLQTVVQLANSNENKIKLMEAGAIEPILAMILSDLPSLAETFVPDFILSSNIQVQTATCLAVLSLSKKPKYVPKLLQANIHIYLVDLLHSPNYSIITYACTVLSRLSATDNNLRETLINANVYDVLCKLLLVPENSVLNEVCSLVGCLLLHPSTNYRKVFIDLNGFPPVIELLSSTHLQLQHRAVNILRLLCYDDASRVRAVENNILPQLARALGEKDTPDNIQKDLRLLLQNLSKSSTISDEIGRLNLSPIVLGASRRLSISS